MSIDKEFSDYKKQVQIQIDRNLISTNKEMAILEKCLRDKNYFNFINGFETLLLHNKNDKKIGYRAGTNLNDFRLLYYFDETLSKEILSSIKEFEVKLKASISYNFSKSYCSTIPNTLNYLNRSYYQSPNTHSYDSDYLTKQFNKHPFFKKFDNFNKTKKLNYADYQKQYVYYLDHYTLPPFWVIIKQLNLNQTYSLLGILKPKVMNDVLVDFKLNTSDRDYLLSCTKLLADLRNHCAHFELANRYRSKAGNYNEIKKKHSFINLLNLGRNKSSLLLFDTLLVLSKFTNTKRIYLIIKIFIIIFAVRNKKWIGEKLLARMGTTNLSPWKLLN